MTFALDVLHREHRSIGAVLYCLDHIVEETKTGRLAPEFAFFDATLRYMREFPDRFHHPKEDEYLFKALRLKKPALGDILDELHQQHVDGDRALTELFHKLQDWQAAPEDEVATTAFLDGAIAYSESQRRHARREETTVMPEARKIFDESDWAPIDAAFSDNDDPLFGERTQQDFAAMFSRIVQLAPEPWGLAERTAPLPKTEDGALDPDHSKWAEAHKRAMIQLNWI